MTRWYIHSPTNMYTKQVWRDFFRVSFFFPPFSNDTYFDTGFQQVWREFLNIFPSYWHKAHPQQIFRFFLPLDDTFFDTGFLLKQYCESETNASVDNQRHWKVQNNANKGKKLKIRKETLSPPQFE